MFRQLGAEIEEREGSRIAVILFNEVHVFHRPHPSPNTDKGAVVSVKKMVGTKWSNPMSNIMKIKGYKALITYDNEIESFRGEFIGLNGGADFYAGTIAELKKEGEKSLQIYLDVCKEKGINPKKEYSGKLPLRISPELHAQLAETAISQGISINQLVQNSLKVK